MTKVTLALVELGPTNPRQLQPEVLPQFRHL
jgi:hypothetical protein